MGFKKFIKLEVSAVVILLTMFTAVGVFGATGLIKPDVKTNMDTGATEVGNTAGYAAVTPDSALILIQALISAFLGVIGVLLLIYIIYAGYNWMTAQGEEEKVEKAKDTLKRAIVGVIIIIAAYAISYFVMSKIETNTLQGGDTPRQQQKQI